MELIISFVIGKSWENNVALLGNLEFCVDIFHLVVALVANVVSVAIII